jgi:hypothetical protein
MYTAIFNQTTTNLEKPISIEKLRNLNSFPTIYHLYNYDKQLKNYVKNIVDRT